MEPSGAAPMSFKSKPLCRTGRARLRPLEAAHAEGNVDDGDAYEDSHEEVREREQPAREHERTMLSAVLNAAAVLRLSRPGHKCLARTL